MKIAGIAGILFLLWYSLSSCGVLVRGVSNGVSSVKNSQVFHQGRHGQLTEEEQKWAQIAWNYFKNNTSYQTGLVNAVDNFPSTTMWQIGDYLAAIVAAYELEIIKREEFDQRLSGVLNFLNTMELCSRSLPNKAYDTQNAMMVNYENKPQEVGWSALDIGRLLAWLAIVKSRYPIYAEYIDKAVLRWNFCDLIDPSGALISGVKTDGGFHLYQEHRLGYEQYAAKAYELWGFNTEKAYQEIPHERISIYGIEIPYDSRHPSESGHYSVVSSLGFLLDGMEFNWDVAEDTKSIDTRHTDKIMAQLAQDIYAVQEARYEHEHIFTARTDHQLPDTPYFVYDSIFAAGHPWNVISGSGEYVGDASLVATKAAFGMWALWKTEYTSKLIEVVSALNNPERGWYEGRKESSGGICYLFSCDTNAIVLESLLYKRLGKCLDDLEPSGFFSKYANDPFQIPGHCLPWERGDR